MFNAMVRPWFDLTVITLTFKILLGLYLGRLFVFRGEGRVDPPALLAPAFSIAYSSATTGWILFKCSTCMQ